MSAELWVAIIGALLTSATLIVVVTKKVTGIETTVNKSVSDLAISIRDLITTNNKEVAETLDKENEGLRKETLKSIKEHIKIYEEKLYQVELYIRDKYIEVDTFEKIITDIKNSIQELNRKLDKLLTN